MKIRETKKSFLAAVVLLLGIMVLGSNLPQLNAKTNISYDDFEEVLDYTKGIISYEDYLQQFDTSKRPDDEYIIEATDYVRTQNMAPEVYKDFEGMTGDSLYIGQSGLIEYEVDIKEEGLYNLSLLYYPIEGESSSIQRSFFIDGELPYNQLDLIELSRIWVNKNDEWIVDNQGNDLKPTQIEKPDWITSYLYDSDGYVTSELGIYLTKGKHTITMVSRREPMVLKHIILNNSIETKSYNEVMAQNESQNYQDTTGAFIEIQAENANRKSSQMLYPTQDQSSPAVSPYSAKELKNNTIGGNSWRIVGQWIEWDFEAPESGYYNITLHSKQNFVKGTYVSRKIMIDGNVPFSELSDYAFKYENKWKMTTLGNDEGTPYKFYLEKGQHTLRMEAVLGDFSSIVGDVQDIVTDLSAQYRKIIRITGVEPDKYRDYQIEKSIPELGDDLAKVEEELDDVIKRLQAVAGSGSDKEAALITMRDQLKQITKDPEKVTKLVKDFKTNLSALGTWITKVLEQPLQLDAIYIYSPDQKLPKVNDSFFSGLAHEAQKLFWSFIIDYNTIGNVAEEDEESKTITVWVGTGRDQANVIKSLIDEKFTINTNINVNVMLVDMNTLLQATLSGQGPDVAIQVANNGGAVATTAGVTVAANDLPMNYGLRNAVVDLSQFSDVDEVKGWFRESALEQFSYEGALYALPETQNFPMMFYRKDILEELGLEVPKTWDEMKVVMSVLSNNQMELGMLASEQIYAMLLYQFGGEYYTEDATASALDSDVAINAFKMYTEFYTDYKLDRETSVEQRFRTGEAPIIIADYTTYNNLMVSAPDIKGMWGFTSVPGMVKEDGSIDNTVASTGLACMIMEQSKDKESAWEFLKWWVSSDIQAAYGREMEGLMGAAARYPTANIEAFDSLPWPIEDYKALTEQFEHVRGIPQVPGGYFSWRNINNAFYRVVVADAENKLAPREAISEYIRYINDEITYKRTEFGMPTADDVGGK